MGEEVAHVQFQSTAVNDLVKRGCKNMFDQSVLQKLTKDNKLTAARNFL